MTNPARRCDVRQGDCLKVLPALTTASVDAVVADPPYGIDFKHHQWDGKAIRTAATRASGSRARRPGHAFQTWVGLWATELLRVLRPGAHLACFGAPRMAHRLACGLENAGFEFRDTLMWLYGTGLPKAGRLPGGRSTQLKPAYEPILLVRKPLAGTVKGNLRLHGTGALNVDACAPDDPLGHRTRWPANVIVSHTDRCRDTSCDRDCPADVIDRSAHHAPACSARVRRPSRLFYNAKASRRERNAGCEHLPARRLDLFPNAAGYTPPSARNSHPTVKPMAVMRWLVRLVTPADGLVLDPFCGSGTTGCAAAIEGRRFLGIELESDYAAIARARIAHWTRPPQRPRRRRQACQRPFAPATRSTR